MTIATEELQRIVADVAEDRCVGTEDHWWHSRVCDFYLDEDFGAHDGQMASDRRRILRIPALERAAAEVICLRARVEAARQLAEAATPYASIVQNGDYARQLRQHDALVAALSAWEAAQ